LRCCLEYIEKRPETVFFYFKITLSFDKNVIEAAKAYAEEQGISLSRLTEYLYKQITRKDSQSLESLPIAGWVLQVAEGAAEYKAKPRSRKANRAEYFDSRKK